MLSHVKGNATHPVGGHDLEALRDVSGVGGQARAAGDEAQEPDRRAPEPETLRPRRETRRPDRFQDYTME